MKLKSFFRRVIRTLGWEVQRLDNANFEEQVLKDVIRITDVKMALDVGANVGQWGDLLLQTGYRGSLLSFEAIPSIHKILEAHALTISPLWRVAPCAALGKERGKISINVSANTVSSSILPMRAAHFDAAPQSKYIDQRIVDIERLDELAAPLLPPNGQLLLKIDTQGYELEVLKGASGLLNRIAAIQLELSLVPLYDGAPEFAEAISYVQSLGYELFGIIPGFKDKRIGRLLQADGFFVRPGSGSDT
jgi:FkbM family methyltransferase